MHIPLLDIPKPSRSRRPAASVLFGLCAVVSFLLLCQYLALQQYVSLYDAMNAPVVEASPVPYVTVTTVLSLPNDGCDLISTYQKPLMELYDELREIEAKVKSHGYVTSCGNLPLTYADFEQICLRHEKEFMRKYTLTQKQVAMIKRDGYRLKHGAGE